MILPVKYNLLSTSQGIDAGLLKLLNVPIDGAVTLKQTLAVLLAVAAGKTDITGSTVTFRDVADTKNRVSAIMTGSERTSVTLDGA